MSITGQRTRTTIRSNSSAQSIFLYSERNTSLCQAPRLDKVTFPTALAPPRPCLIVADAAKAIAFYVAAFDAVAEERRTSAGGTRIAHAALSVFGGIVELADDDAPRDTQGLRAPTALGATTLTLHVDFAGRTEVDRVLARAARAGAEITFPAREMDWGAWYGRLRDPFGHAWSFAGALA